MNAPLLDGLPSQKQLDAVFTRVELDLRPTRSRWARWTARSRHAS